MAEYNFWDDRTTEENDDYWCPIKMCYCISDDCENCEEYKEFEDYVNRHFKDEINPTITTCDIANYIKHTCCCFYGWLCPSHNFKVCSNMAIISIHMILDHLY